MLEGLARSSGDTGMSLTGGHTSTIPVGSRERVLVVAEVENQNSVVWGFSPLIPVTV